MSNERAPVVSGARRDLDEVVGEFGSAAERLAVARPSPAELNDLCRRVAAFTAELFPGEMRVRIKNDPEIVDDLYFVFGVNATGAVDEIAARNDEWHGRVCRVASNLPGLFRLSITVR